MFKIKMFLMTLTIGFSMSHNLFARDPLAGDTEDHPPISQPPQGEGGGTTERYTLTVSITVPDTYPENELFDPTGTEVTCNQYDPLLPITVSGVVSGRQITFPNTFLARQDFTPGFTAPVECHAYYRDPLGVTSRDRMGETEFFPGVPHPRFYSWWIIPPFRGMAAHGQVNLLLSCPTCSEPAR